MIEIIGSVDQNIHYTAQQINELLIKQKIELTYGTDFVGRPTTYLYIDTDTVVKLHIELDLNEIRAKRYVIHTLERERQLNIHHPSKTWFLLQQEDKNIIGNICPFLTPINTIKQHDNKLSFLEKIYHFYFYAAKKFNLRLDDGLANFGIDKEYRVYYLDDDLYGWDNFFSLAHSLGVLIRGNAWMNEEYAALFGDILQQLIVKYFDDNITIMLARTLSDIFMPNNEKQQILNIIIRQLQQQKTISKTVSISQENYIAILADIHANLPALDAVLAYLKERNIKHGIVLGDIVGYGPYPCECIDRLRETELQVIKGNHDHAAATGDSNYSMSKMAAWCIDWTVPRLSSEQRQWLNDLPLELTGIYGDSRKWQAVHGSPMDPNYFYAYVYQMTYEQNLDVLAERGIDFCFHGHSHIQGVYGRNPLNNLDEFIKPQGVFSLEPYQNSLICPGSIGQPRDGSLGAQFAVYNPKKHELQFIVVHYPIEAIIKAMQDYEFPDTLWHRLQRGT
ncbi:hypothetical protein DOJK_00080 [Patescibacteria group bacterium]|nr:hypothetical protein DOJK_00080 [Patescibacteria group bacterium]